MGYFKHCLEHYADFSGRARRREYWWFCIFQAFFAILFVAIGTAIDIALGKEGVVASVIVFLFEIGIFLPALAVLVRRLHDIGKSGWWMWISLIPIIGSIILFVFMLLDSQPGTNKYGPNPKGF